MKISPEFISAEQITQLRNQAFRQEFDFQPDEISRGIDEYNELLPTFKGRGFRGLLENRLSSTYRPIRVLDIGSGACIALGEMVRNYSAKIAAYGISSRDYIDRMPDWQLYTSQVNLTIGDAQKLKDYFEPGSFDLVVGVFAFDYLVDPLGTLEQAYYLLDIEGVVLTHNLLLPLTGVEEQTFSKYLEQNGVTPEFRYRRKRKVADERLKCDVAWQRNTGQDLDLPFVYLPPEEDEWQLNYRLVIAS